MIKKPQNTKKKTSTFSLFSSRWWMVFSCVDSFNYQSFITRHWYFNIIIFYYYL